MLGRRDSRLYLILAILCCTLFYGLNSHLSGVSKSQIAPAVHAVHAVRTVSSVSKALTDPSLTLVTQCNLERIWLFPALLERWKGPIALAVLYPVNTTRETVASTTGHFPARVNVLNVIHRGGEYPINILRNMATKLVNTSHYLVIDVDMVPSEDLARIVLDKGMHKWLFSSRVALVVPAFERTSPQPCLRGLSNCLSLIPPSYDSLTKCVSQQRCQVHHEDEGNFSHSTTDNERWLSPNLTVSSYPILCFDSILYEPYVVLPRHPDTPKFNERFVGYGNNKIQFITHLRFAGFNFRVIAKAFLFHQAHQMSWGRKAWLSTEAGLNARMTKLFQEFKVSLEKKYLAPSTPLCANTARAPKEEGDEPIFRSNNSGIHTTLVI